VLQLRGGGQHVVGVVGGVGHEVLQHHGEQVLARKAGAPPCPTRAPPPPGCCCRPPAPRSSGRRRATVSRSRSSPMVLMLMVRGAAPASRSGRCSARVRAGTSPSSTAARRRRGGARRRSGRAAGDQPHRIAAAAHALHAVVQADGGRAGWCRSRAPGRAPVGTVMPQTCGRALGRPLQRALAQRGQPSVWRAM
jgi:hypothetical protein